MSTGNQKRVFKVVFKTSRQGNEPEVYDIKRSTFLNPVREEVNGIN
jgi:hypothetical protein